MNIHQLLKDCLHYPSGDNAQPFRFRLDSDTRFHIFHDSAIAAHRLNYKNLASVMTLGTLIELISLNAKKNKFNIEIHYHPENFSESGFFNWATVNLKPTSEGVSEHDQLLIDFSKSRHVDRRPYEQSPLSNENKNWLAADFAQNSKVHFSIHQSLNADLKLNLLKFEETIWKDLILAQDIFSWIRFDDRSIEKHRDGMSWRTLGIHIIQKPLLQLFCRFPIFYKVMVALGATKANRQILNDQLTHNGGVGFLSVKSSSPNDLIEVGRAYMRVWIYLNAQGFGFQPVTMAPLSTFQFKTKNLPPDWSPKLHSVYPELLKSFQAQFGEKFELTPVWGFRTGLVKTPLAPSSKSLRKEIDDLILPSEPSSSRSSA